MPNHRLNKKHAIFVREYLIDQNGTRAAIAAGYSAKTAGAAAPRLLKDVRIQAEIDRVLTKTCDKLEVSVENVLRELARLAFLDPRNFYNESGGLKHVTELDEDTARCLVGMEVEDLFGFVGDDIDGRQRVQTGFCRKIKFADKGANLERLGRYLKMFTDKSEQSITITDNRKKLARLSDEEAAVVRKLVNSVRPTNVGGL